MHALPCAGGHLVRFAEGRIDVNSAQDAIEAGDTVTGELTEDTFAVEYTYEGKADEVVVITLAPVDVLGELNNPAIIVRDEGGDDLLRYDGYGSSTVVVLLPEDGEYTIVATRTDDAAGTSIGEYTLTVVRTSGSVLVAVAHGQTVKDAANDAAAYVGIPGSPTFP